MAVQTHESTAGIHRFTLDEYHQLAEIGALSEEVRVELIAGFIVDMRPKSASHEKAIRWLAEWLFGAVDLGSYEIGVQTALTIEAAGSEPEPDLAVIAREAPRPYHPATASLVIEIAVSSEDRDLRVKSELYALAGVPDYWVVLLERRRVVVHRTPVDHGYESIGEFGPETTLEAVALDLPPLPIADLFAAASA
jgi:Uma2 family endonuclease